MAHFRSRSANFGVLSLLFIIANISCVKTALFDGCDNSWSIQQGYTYLQSPNYPQYYPSGTSCRYKFVAPQDYQITINCTIELDKGASQCTTEKFYIATDGDSQLRGSEELCGKGNAVRYSVFNSVALAYVSYGSYGRFQCSFYAVKKPCDCGWSVSSRIMNGQEAGINEYPSMVALRVNGQSPYCGGSIITHRHILTAGHCADAQPNPNNIVARVGDHDLSTTAETKYSADYAILSITKHPSYTSNPVKNDIAIFTTVRDIDWSRGVGPICLPPNANNNYAYTYVDVLGWGTLYLSGPTSNKLLKANLMVVDNTACQQNYQGVATISSTNLCTYDSSGKSKDACQYDSGGPVCLIVSARRFLIGIISFGKVCGQGGYAMGVNERITAHLAWINQVTGNTVCPVTM